MVFSEDPTESTTLYTTRTPELNKGQGSLTNNFWPANFEKLILQKTSTFYYGYKI